MRKTQKDYLYAQYDYSRDFVFEGMVSGCCFAIKKETIEKMRGFDENTFLFGEEDIIGIKLMRMGQKAGVCVDSKVIHKGSTLIGKKPSPFNDYYRYVSAYYTLVQYANINKLEQLIVSIINFGAFILKSINNPDYLSKLRALVREYKYITKKSTNMLGGD
ncbi:MAG: glycosyltransferase family 2 protein [Peptococcia bacterium]